MRRMIAAEETAAEHETATRGVQYVRRTERRGRPP
jgi:hypothetical protein